MSNVNYFTNDNFRVLSYLFDMKGSDNVARITQQEVADSLKISRITCNRIFQALKLREYIIPDPLHLGRYTLTNKAIKVVTMFRKSDKNTRKEK